MAGIRDLVTSARGGGPQRTPTLLGRLGLGAARGERGGAGAAGDPLAALSSSGTRIEASRELARSAARLLDAARALEGRAPNARFDARIVERENGSEAVARTETIEVTSETVTPATAPSQTSILFDAVDQTVAELGSEIRFAINGPDVRIDVGLGGATLEELVDLINQDSENQGRIVASIVADQGGFRLRTETTETGADAELRISRDRVNAPVTGTPSSPPEFGRYEIFDSGLGDRFGEDEIVEQTTTTETVSVLEEVPVFEQVEERRFVDDNEFEALSREFANAFNALQAQIAQRPELASLTGPFASSLTPGADDGLGTTLASVLARFEAGENAASTALADVGFARDSGGVLRIDSARLQQAIAASPERVSAVLSTGTESLAREVGSLVREDLQLAGVGASGLLASNEGLADSEVAARSRFRLVETLFRR